MAFWGTTISDSTQADPKRNFRFKVTFGGFNDLFLWWAKSATKPSFTIAAAEHKYLNHTFYYPGTVTWNDITITMVDPGDPDMAASLSGLLTGGGYHIPGTSEDLKTMTKATAVTALGSVTVEQMDAEGAPTETWVLKNAFISDIKYGDLSYGNDDLTEMSITLKYDWATLTTKVAGSATKDPNTDFFSTTSTEVV
jgi:hypothetical protein